MNELDITAQKSVVLDEDESKNSFRPILEEAWFGMNYDAFRKRLDVFYGRERIAKILWVSWNEGIQRRRKYSPIYIIWSDTYEEMSFDSELVPRYIRTVVWSCRLKLLWTKGMDEKCDFNNFESFYTKFPKSFKSLLLDKIIEEQWIDRDASEWCPDNIKFWEIYQDLDERILSSFSPDTEIADLKEQNPNLNYAAWERVSSWNTALNLWLNELKISWLQKLVSTQVYANLNRLTEVQRERLDLMKERIDNCPMWEIWGMPSWMAH